MIFFAFSGLFVMIFWRQPYGSKDYQVIRGIIMLVPIMSSVPLHYGIYYTGKYNKAEKIEDVRIIDNKIVFWDKAVRKTKYSEVWHICRLYIANIDNGELQNRTFYQENASTEFVSGNKILIKNVINKKESFSILDLNTYSKDVNTDNIYEIKNKYELENNPTYKKVIKPKNKSKVKYLIIYKNGELFCRSPETSKQIWKIDRKKLDIEEDTKPANFVQFNNRLIFSVSDCLYCIDFETGNLQWKRGY